MFGLLQQGGPLVWLISACGVVALVVFFERVLHLHRARIKSDDFLKGICNNLSRGNIAEAIAICDETPGPVAYIIKTAIMNRGTTKESMREAIDNAGRTEISRMERRLVVIATVAQIAPLLGLLGTVWGMIRSLLVMQQQAPLVQSADMAGGLIQALVVTAVGLLVTIPCYVAFNFLVGRVEKIVLDMERAASEILTFMMGPSDAVNGGGSLDDRQG